MEQRLSKKLASIALVMIKTLPMLLAFLYLLDTILCFFGYEGVLLVYLKELIIIFYLYICSYLFQLCWRHRLFLHYLLVSDILNVYDYYIGIPVSNYNLCVILTTLSVLYFSFILYKFLKHD